MASRLILSCLLATTVALSSGRAEAFQTKHTADGHAVSWRAASVAWTVDATVRAVPGAEDAVTAAVAAWSGRAGAPALTVAHVDAELQPGLDGTNGVFYADRGFPAMGDLLAVTVLSFDDESGEVLDADIVLNGKYPLGIVPRQAARPTAVGSGDTASTASTASYDVGRVVAHEMGHALALGDELGQSAALMYPYVPRGVLLATSPGPDDVAGLATLYDGAAAAVTQPVRSEATGTAGSATGCAVGAVPRSPGGSATLWLVGGLAVALVLWRGSRSARARRGAAGCTALAATALFALPSASPSASAAVHDEAPAAVLDAHATVTSVRTTSDHGLFRTEVDVSITSCVTGDCPPASRFVTWGGTVGHVRQVIGGAYVPAVGEPVGLVLERRVVRSIAPLARN